MKELRGRRTARAGLELRATSGTQRGPTRVGSFTGSSGSSSARTGERERDREQMEFSDSISSGCSPLLLSPLYCFFLFA